MPENSTLRDHLKTLGIHLPAWPRATGSNGAIIELVKRGKSYSENIQKWRAELNKAPGIAKTEVAKLLNHLNETRQLEIWDQLVYEVIEPHVQGRTDQESLQTCKNLINSGTLKSEELIGITLDLAQEQRLAASIYGLKLILKENSQIDKSQRQELCCEWIAMANTSRLMAQASTNEEDWDIAVELNELLIGLLKKASSGSKQEIIHKLDEIENCLYRKGKHGDANFIATCHKRLPQILKTWAGVRPCIMQIGCKNEIIEGQNSTAQLLEVAQQLELIFAAIDLDKGNIEALIRDYREFKATWITGTDEEALKTWSKPIAAVYLKSYKFEQQNHSDYKQKVDLERYEIDINDTESHIMHLEAARYCSRHMIPGGLIGLDDTWLENGDWAGKGELAMPWLLNQGWELLSSVNRSTILIKNKRINECLNH